MTDLISREAVINMLVDWPKRLGVVDPRASVLFAERLGCLETLAAVRHEVDRLPAVDAVPVELLQAEIDKRVATEKTNRQILENYVPVVRCKDCRYRCESACPMFHTEWYWDEDDGSDPYDVDRTEDDGFCYFGERMDGDGNG